MPEIALLALRPAFWCKGRCFAQTNLQPDFAFAAVVPVMRVRGVHAPGETILRLVITVSRDGELNALLRLLEGRHHVEDHCFMVVLFEAGKVEIGREPSLAADHHFPQACAAFECELIK